MHLEVQEKIFLINLILAKVRSSGDIAVAVVPSGIAATLMSGWRTVHPRFKNSLLVNENDLYNFELKNSHAANLFRSTKTIMWNDCLIMRREAFEAVDQTLQDVCNNNTFWGEILTIYCSDCQQFLPVIKRDSDANVEKIIFVVDI